MSGEALAFPFSPSTRARNTSGSDVNPWSKRSFVVSVKIAMLLPAGASFKYFSTWSRTWSVRPEAY